MYEHRTTFTDPNFMSRTVRCAAVGCMNVIRQWLSRWGWLDVCAECAALRWESEKLQRVE